MKRKMEIEEKQPASEQPAQKPKFSPDIQAHLDRVRDYALEHPCILDDDFINVFAGGLNRMVWDYSTGWLVSIIVSISTEDYQTLFWQVSTALVNRITGQPKTIGILAKDERRQLQLARDVVIAEIADSPIQIDKFQLEKAFHATCGLSDSETLIALAHFNEKQLEVWKS